MNIKKFKEIVSTWENNEEKFRLFRVWAENCYILYEKKVLVSKWVGISSESGL